MTRDFYIIKMPHQWFKILDTPKGMTWYTYIIILGKIKWIYNSFEKGKKIMDYNQNFTILDYNPHIHDQMILQEHNK